MEGMRIFQSNRPDLTIASTLPVVTFVARFMILSTTPLQFEKSINRGVQIFPDGSFLTAIRQVTDLQDLNTREGGGINERGPDRNKTVDEPHAP